MSRASAPPCTTFVLLRWALVLCLALAVTPANGVELARAIEFDIPAQSLSTALIRFGQHTRLQIVTLGQGIETLSSPGVRGSHTIDAALERLLRGTGLTYRAVGEGTIAIIASQRVTSDALPRAGESPALDAEAIATQQRPVAPPELQTVVITGSHIRGIQSAGAAVIVIDRREIDSSGHATLVEVLKSLPQNFPGGLSEDDNTDHYAANYNYGTAVNLRGLGTASTLVLVNGHRQPAGGATGGFVDISNIPSAAVERIEMLTDGASAIYGSDAVGGVLNIVLRDDYEGAETRAYLGTAGGDAEQVHLSQLFGLGGAEGNLLLGYEHQRREPLSRYARRRTASAGDQRAQGGDDFRLMTSNPGNILHPITLEPVFAIPRGQDGRTLGVDELLPGVVNRYDLPAPNELLPRREFHAAFLNGSRRIGAHLESSAQLRYTRRETRVRASGEWAGLVVPPTNPFYVDPFGGQPYVIVAYNFIDDFGPMLHQGRTESYSAVLTGRLTLDDEWRLSVAGGYGSERTLWRASNALNYDLIQEALADPNPATAFNPFGDGSHTAPETIERLRTSRRERGVSGLGTLNVIADGPLFDLSAGPARLAFGADHREETLRYDGRFDSSRAHRGTTSVFAELAVPVIGGDSALRGVRRLDLSLAGRYERYSDFGGTFNPRLGWRWQMLDSFRLHGTWGTSFRAPRLAEIDGKRPYLFSIVLPLADPKSPSGYAVALLRVGDNTGLKEETAATWTVGFEWTPARWPSASFSLTYHDIDYRDRVAFGGPADDPLSILLEEHLWESVIDRSPAREEMDAVCATATFPSAPLSCETTQPSMIVDLRYLNLASVEVSGLDFVAGQRFDMHLGSLDLRLSGSYVARFARAVSDTSPRIDIAGTLGQVPKLHMRGLLSWSRGAVEISGAVNHLDAFLDDRSRPARSIDSWTTVDLRLSYGVPAGARWLETVEISVGAVNLFDRAPPFANTFSGYDIANADVLGRVLSLQLVKRW